MAGKPETGLSALRHAHGINPNCATTRGWLGMYEATHGIPACGVPHAKAALRFSPRDPSRPSLLAALGFAQFAIRDYHAAARTADMALSEAPGSATPLVLGRVAWVGAGQIDKAVAGYERLGEIAPKLAEARLAGRWLSTSPDYLTRAHTFMRIAAGPEPEDAAVPLR